MSELKKLQTKHKEEIKTLQDNCPHDEKSEWVDYMWAPGHRAGQVKYCLCCGKTMERQT